MLKFEYPIVSNTKAETHTTLPETGFLSDPVFLDSLMTCIMEKIPFSADVSINMLSESLAIITWKAAELPVVADTYDITTDALAEAFQKNKYPYLIRLCPDSDTGGYLYLDRMLGDEDISEMLSTLSKVLKDPTDIQEVTEAIASEFVKALPDANKVLDTISGVLTSLDYGRVEQPIDVSADDGESKESDSSEEPTK